MIIDVHAHAFPDQIAQRAMKKLSEASNIPAFGDGTTRGLLASMDAAGIDASVVCAIATKVGQAAGILAWCAGIRSERLIAFPSVHPDEPDAAAWVKRFAEEGFVGLKMHPMYQDCAADDGRMKAIYAAAAQHGLLVTSHCGYDIAYPPDDDRAAPRRFAAALDEIPTLRLLCTHMGGWRAWDEVEECLIGKNIWLETSFSLDDLSTGRAAAMITRHGIDRVCFGSDWPWNAQDESIRQIDRLGFAPDQRRLILGDNAARMLRLAK